MLRKNLTLLSETQVIGRKQNHTDRPEVQEVVTPPASTAAESGKEEERLQQEQDGPIMSTLYSDNGGGKAVDTEELIQVQRYDESLKGIREKARMSDKPYFWKEGFLMSEPYHIIGKNLIIYTKGCKE